MAAFRGLRRALGAFQKGRRGREEVRGGRQRLPILLGVASCVFRWPVGRGLWCAVPLLFSQERRSLDRLARSPRGVTRRSPSLVGRQENSGPNPRRARGRQGTRRHVRWFVHSARRRPRCAKGSVTFHSMDSYWSYESLVPRFIIGPLLDGPRFVMSNTFTTHLTTRCTRRRASGSARTLSAYSPAAGERGR